ncbi:hypothetical protein ITI46_28405 [Streptomyces oryzae]|uniref:Uncharacterized protein n=1 Tax=Streptomyces oryzae TaxID=1434886 RepID=A0ABS3XJQ2_9ACTN|nr:hypothetical protein [Streptomyces oryzae]MBO8195541.1 hypothetical protein [Streptomyces oryzae]
MRWLRFGVYADDEGLEFVQDVIRRELAGRCAAPAGLWVRTGELGGGVTAEEMYGDLREQWAVEHPGEDPGARRPAEVAVRVKCSLRVWRALRKGILRGLCPEGSGPHVCRVPWAAR